METEDTTTESRAEPVRPVNCTVNSSFREASTTQAPSTAAYDELKDGDYTESERSESTWLSRAQTRTEELRKMFQLPHDEVRPQSPSALLAMLNSAETPYYGTATEGYS